MWNLAIGELQKRSCGVVRRGRRQFVQIKDNPKGRNSKKIGAEDLTSRPFAAIFVWPLWCVFRGEQIISSLFGLLKNSCSSMHGFRVQFT